MTTFTDFAPTPFAPFTFQPTLDGNQYTATLTWNLFSQSYYINIFDLSGNLVVARKLIGSDVGVDTTSLSWNNGTVTVVTSTPHGNAIGKTINLTVVGVVPDAYNGIVSALILDASTFSYALASNPGLATQQGVVNYDISLTGGYFDSTLVYRQSNSQFEVSP
jgi:hypothetical protein